MADQRTDDELLTLYQREGDLFVLHTLYKRYHSMIYGLALKYFKNTHDSEDAAIQIFELLVKKAKTHKVLNFKPWLYSLTKNYCLDKLRKAGRNRDREREAEFMYSQQIFHPDNVMEKEKEFELLEKCLERLPEKQKACIRLFYFQKHSYNELSEQLNLKWNTVRSFIQNGRRNLKICMDNEDV